ncbi:S8 family serine peptidase [Chloroflexi bacterium TSY]|nr:S8 family serine peptidase [Chloroflexi bacterium TSY]
MCFTIYCCTVVLGTAFDSDILDDVIADAVNAGIVVVAASGNLASNQPLFPAAEDGVLAVGAVDQYKQITAFSNFGDWISVAAPGEGIYSAFPIDGYASWSGTSMATPFVAAQAALIRAASPGLTGAEIVNRILTTAEPLQAELGAGLIDLFASLPTASDPPSSSGCHCEGVVVSAGTQLNCSSTLNLDGITVDSIVVAEGQSARLNGTTVTSNVQILSQASLTATGVRVDGNIQADGASAVIVRQNSDIGGDIQIKLGGDATITDTRIDGNLQLEENNGPIQASRNEIGGDLQAFKNSGGLIIELNNVNGSLQCKDNSPAPTVSGNQAASMEDQCAADMTITASALVSQPNKLLFLPLFQR